ncbi:unnamed protein product [Lactuca virosa]|uniref:RING-type domain-containing protein n=1 Tax=Lactuca virosa TaxID=75947 RepID=A0AAU9MDM2_9ASTR|nr:unnamed protein product [Lactuca virosa]
MTSASKLFHNRRIRFGVHNNAVDDKDSDSSPAKGNSSRHITNRRHHNRRNLEGSDTPSRRIHRHRHSELVQLEAGGSHDHSPSGSIINSEDFRSIRRWGTTENDRLPGVVLLARERLLERLRGVHVSENSRSSSSLHEDDDLLYNVYNSFIDEPVSGVIAMPSSTRILTPGLSQDALNCLLIKVYKYDEKINESSSASRECSICLEGFEEGDELINLPCMHRFHSCCLFPWVEVCGACPNCRKVVVISSN